MRSVTGAVAATACVLAQGAQAASVTLACEGRLIRHSPDLTRQIETRGAQRFEVVFDIVAGRLEQAPAERLDAFVRRDAGDAVFFFRNHEIGGRAVLEWISINRLSGDYSHFIAFRGEDPPGVSSPVLLGAATCRPAR